MRLTDSWVSVFTAPGGVDVSLSDDALAALDKLRIKLQGELEELMAKRSGLETELKALSNEIEFRQRAVELLKATEGRLVAQGPEHQSLEGAGSPGTITQVRGSATPVVISEPCGPPGVCVRAVKAHASGSPQAVPTIFA
jgi:hypothetical protein